MGVASPMTSLTKASNYLTLTPTLMINSLPTCCQNQWQSMSPQTFICSVMLSNNGSHKTDFDFGFIPLTNLVLTESKDFGPGFESPIDQHYVAKDYGIPNFVSARLPVKSQLNISVWEDWLVDYWDNLFYLFRVLRRFQHCTGHITTGSWKGRGNQYIQFIRVLYCKLPTNGKQPSSFAT